MLRWGAAEYTEQNQPMRMTVPILSFRLFLSVGLFFFFDFFFGRNFSASCSVDCS